MTLCQTTPLEPAGTLIPHEAHEPAPKPAPRTPGNLVVRPGPELRDDWSIPATVEAGAA